ncbi:MAG TPA: cytochrome c [Flavipsychrobacter sp.]|nr:cytochrome c [Flavipsychrobacter sp.]
MNIKAILLIGLVAAISLGSCGGEEKKETTQSEILKEPGDNSGQPVATTSDPAKGIGKFQNVELTHPLDEKMVASGKEISEVKCLSCHKLSDEKLVGPGWKGVTDRRTPEWIMNFVTNVDEMLDKDPESQAMLEVCMVRMPNQNLSDNEARAVLEYMRKNDGKN